MKNTDLIGRKFEQRLPKGKKRLCTIVDFITCTNSKGEVIKSYFVSTHEFMGQTITDHEVPRSTVSRGLLK